MNRLLAWMALCGAAFAQDPMAPETRPAGSAEVSQIQDYTRALSKKWLNQAFNLDIDAIGWNLKRRARAYSEVNLERASPGSEMTPSGIPGETAQPVLRALSLRLEQYDDLLRITRDPQDIPFALKLDAEGRVLGGLILSTSLSLPLSWKDEMRAEARVPLPDLTQPFFASLLDAAGLGSRWALRSTYTNRLGLSSVQAGLGTQWLKLWSLQYDYKVRFGQGEEQESHWLKLEREF